VPQGAAPPPPRRWPSFPNAAALVTLARDPASASQPVVYCDDRVVVVRDMFAKAAHHLLVINPNPNPNPRRPTLMMMNRGVG
jgi:hypothetical protein